MKQKTLCIHKLRLILQSLTTLKIGELLLTTNSPNLNDLTIWRISANGPLLNLVFDIIWIVTLCSKYDFIKQNSPLAVTFHLAGPVESAIHID